MKTGIRELHPRRAFRIARARRNAVRNVFVQLENGRASPAYGEASPNAFYDETAEGVLERSARGRGLVEHVWKSHGVADVEERLGAGLERVAPSRAAQCALDLALWDWLARTPGRHRLRTGLGRSAAAGARRFARSDFRSPEELAEKLAELRGFPRIKIKSDEAASLETVRSVRERVRAPLLAVDANCAWSSVDLRALSADWRGSTSPSSSNRCLPRDDALLPRRGCALPIFADESCVTEADVPRIAAHFDGFNIKLVKCGGLTPALRMARRARALGMRTMVGCMLESSVLIAAGAVVAQRTDFADLDGAWLIGNDPARGWSFDRGELYPPTGLGLGATFESDLF